MADTSTTASPRQAVKWQAILQGGQKLTGGTGSNFDVNVSAVTVPLVELFTVSGTTFSDTMYVANGKETWYENGKEWTATFPLEYTLQDGSTLTITRNSDSAGDLTYTQQ
ncbi:hypothetical protein [Alicyclobacillus dauci]|uniref:Uncharacterized protein n=1 Tax=Alicyclobacillus dauci TaxID=1475485 RepID=A0ABY6Z6V3_9BACL|nr:hypothetical protein [Alicyclobacillus dauci]WAH38622.1 hypothetical protein NZD86_09130 [Alicyclobacillus dauci]